MTTLRALILLLSGALFQFTGCTECVSRESSTTTLPDIDAAKARSLVLARYRNLFGDKYLQNQLDRKYYPWPPLKEANLDAVEENSRSWAVHADPETGVVIDARVDKKGEWIEIVRVAFVYQ